MIDKYTFCGIYFSHFMTWVVFGETAIDSGVHAHRTENPCAVFVTYKRPNQPPLSTLNNWTRSNWCIIFVT